MINEIQTMIILTRCNVVSNNHLYIRAKQSQGQGGGFYNTAHGKMAIDAHAYVHVILSLSPHHQSLTAHHPFFFLYFTHIYILACILPFQSILYTLLPPSFRFCVSDHIKQLNEAKSKKRNSTSQRHVLILSWMNFSYNLRIYSYVLVSH